MSSLRSALDELRAEDPARLSDEELESDFAEAERAARALAAQRHRLLGEIHRRQSWRKDGYLNSSTWLAHRFGSHGRWPSGGFGRPRSLEEMASTREALADGEVSPCAVRVLVSAREAHGEDFSQSEEALLHAARTLTARELRRLVTYWRQALDGPQGLQDAEWRWRLRRLHLSPMLGGMVRVDGDLDPETGQTLITAINAVLDAEGHGGTTDHPRTCAQRRADALGEICRGFLDSSERPQVGGERPHVTVTVNLEALTRGAGAPCEFDDVGPTHPEIARRWA